MKSELMQLRAQIRTLSARLDQRPVQTMKPSGDYLVVVIVGGNTLETGQPGVKYSASVGDLPSAYDPNVTSSFIDGVGRGTLYVNGVAQTGYVLVINDSNGTFLNDLVQTDRVWCSRAISAPVSGGASVTAYQVG